MGVDAKAPRLSWTLHQADHSRNKRQSAYHVLVASSQAHLNKNRGDLWDSGVVRSSQQNNVRYGGKALKSKQACFWKVRVSDETGQWSPWSRGANWEMGLLDSNDWRGSWIDDGKPLPNSDAEFYEDDPAPLFRKELVARMPVKQARLTIAGLGYYEARINGMPVDDTVLNPGWTNYAKRVLVDTVDVTRLVVKGKNCMGVSLGNGWFNPLPLRMWGSRNIREALLTGRPRFIAQLHVDYVDGSSDTFASDETWKVADGPILRNSVYLGEVIDARLNPSGWDRVGFDDRRWRRVRRVSEPIGALKGPTQPPIRATRNWTAKSVREPKPGTFVYDMGENFAGWVTLKLDVPSGTKVHVRYGELITPDGSLNPMTSVAGQIKGLKQGTQESVGGPGAPPIAWQSTTYVARGGGETVEPKFAFHGFRFVEITGVPKALPLESVIASFVHTDLESTGSFQCSNPLLNQIQSMCRRTFLSNVFSVQSDCPHREKFGYGGDIVATSEAFIMNFDMAGFYQKAVRDWADSALADGMFTDTAPFVGIQYYGVVWAMAHPLLVDQLYRYYGDSLLGQEQYAAAKRWLALVDAKYPSGIVTDGLSDHEGLAPAPAPAMVTPFYYISVNLIRDMALRQGHKADAARFGLLAEKIKSAFQSQFIDMDSGQVGPGTQASQSIALYAGLVPDPVRPRAFEFLVNDIEKQRRHLTTGILGTKVMLEVLSREGRIDLAYDIVTQDDFPSWGWMLKNGATTLWEHWAFSDNTFSHNHPMFGSVSQWFMQWLGGIRPDQGSQGFDRVLITPKVPQGLDWVKSSYRSVRGTFVSNWKRDKDSLHFEISVPPNATATVSLPATSVVAVSEGGLPLSRLKGITNVMSDGSSVSFRVGSGRYEFRVRQSSTDQD